MIVTGQDGEFTIDLLGGKPRIMWRHTTALGYWRSVSLTRKEAIEAAAVLLNGAEAMTDIRCSFCDKSNHEVRTVVAGPSTFICDECVALCADIVKEAGP